jgi:hypothetical protein
LLAPLQEIVEKFICGSPARNPRVTITSHPRSYNAIEMPSTGEKAALELRI